MRIGGQRLFAKSIQTSFLQGLDFYVFDGIHRLPAPRGEAAQVEAVIGKLQRAVELGRDHIHVRSQTRLTALFSAYNESAHRYGLNDCLVDGTRLLRIEAF